MKRMKRLGICIVAMLCLGLVAAEGFAVERTEIWVDQRENDFDHPIQIEVGEQYFVDEGNTGWMRFKTGVAGNYTLTTEAITGAITVEIHTRYEEKLCSAYAAFASDGPQRANVYLEANTEYWAHLYFISQLFTLQGKSTFAICGPDRHAGEGKIGRRKATCTEAGFEVNFCEICGEDMVERTMIPATGHTPGEWQTETPATCTEQGKAVQCCTACGEAIYSREIPATGHIMGEWQTMFEPACLQSGLRVRKCTVCGETLESKEIPATGHFQGGWQTVLEAACLQSGLRVRKCTVCGETLESEEIPALGHEYTEWEVLYEPTKKSEGERQRHCVHCGDTQQEKIEKLPKFLGLF